MGEIRKIDKTAKTVKIDQRCKTSEVGKTNDMGKMDQVGKMRAKFLPDSTCEI